MAEKEEKGGSEPRYPSLFWPVILITAGVLLLLNNLGMLRIDFWQLWRLWPVLLILAGLDLLFGRRSFVGSLVVLLITLAVMAGVVLLLVASPAVLGPAARGEVERIEEPRAAMERASLAVDFAAGQLTVGALVDSANAVEVDLDLAAGRQPSWGVKHSGSSAEMTLGSRTEWRPGSSDRWHVWLSPQVAFSLKVDVGAGSAVIDLTGLDIHDLQVDAGAGQTTVILPDGDDFSARISGGVGSLIIEIPRELAARLRVERGLGTLDLPARFEKVGDLYITEGWEGSDHRVDLAVEVGIGLVTIRDR